MKYFFIYLAFYATQVTSSETIDFNTFTSSNQTTFIESYQGKEVEIRGFLYKEGDDYILANLPNLKTCCLKPGDSRKALSVEGLGLASFVGSSVKLRGILYIDPDDKSSEIHLLASIPIEDDEGKYILFAIYLLVIVLISGVGFFLWSNMKKVI